MNSPQPRSRPSLHSVASSLAPLALSAAATAAPQFSYEPPYTLQLDHPVPPASPLVGDAKAVVLGQLTGDAVPDACVLHGTELHLKASVDRRNVWLKLSGTYTDMTLLPQGQAGVRDAVLAVGPTGLVRLVWNGSPGVETLVPAPVPGTSAWVGATQLQVGQAPSGQLQVLALDSSARTLLRATYTPGTGSLTPLTSIQLDTTATALTGLDFSSNTDLEYAVAGSSGVVVLSQNGVELQRMDEPGNRALLVRVPVEGAFDRLAWIRGPGGGVDFLSVLHSNGVVDPAIWLLGATIAQATLADLCEDDREELLLLADGSPYAIGLRRDSQKTFLDFSNFHCVLDLERGNTLVGNIDGYPFVAGTGVYGGAGKAPVPAARDLDGDGDDDLFFAGHPAPGGAGRAMVFLGTKYREEVDDESVGTKVRAWIPSYSVSASQDQDSAEIVFAVPQLPTSGPASAATHVQYTVWTQTQNAALMDAGSEQVRRVDLTQRVLEEMDPVVLPDLSSLGDGAVHIESTFLRLDPATGAMLAAYPAYHEKLMVSWFVFGQTLVFTNGEAGVWGPPQGMESNDGGVGGTSGRPPITPPSGP